MHIDHIAFHTLKILIHLPLKPRLSILWVDFPKTESNHLSYTGVWVGKGGAMANEGRGEGKGGGSTHAQIHWYTDAMINLLLVLHQLVILFESFDFIYWYFTNCLTSRYSLTIWNISNSNLYSNSTIFLLT